MLGAKFQLFSAGIGVDAAHYRGDYALVAAAAGGSQLQGEAVEVVVAQGAEHMEPRVRALHDMTNWIVVTDCSNDFNLVNRTAFLGGAQLRACTNAVPGARCCGVRPKLTRFIPNGFRGDPDDRLVQRGPAGGPYRAGDVLCVVWTVTEAFQEDCEGEGVWSPSLTWAVYLSVFRVSQPTRLELLPSSSACRMLDDIGIVTSPIKNVVLPPKRQFATVAEISLFEEGVVAGVPTRTDQYVIEHAMVALGDGCADRLARCPAERSDKQAASRIAIKPQV